MRERREVFRERRGWLRERRENDLTIGRLGELAIGGFEDLGGTPKECNMNSPGFQPGENGRIGKIFPSPRPCSIMDEIYHGEGPGEGFPWLFSYALNFSGSGPEYCPQASRKARRRRMERCRVIGSWFMVLGSWSLVNGSWY